MPDAYFICGWTPYGTHLNFGSISIPTDDAALAEELEMDAPVEAHDETEVERAVACGAQIIGVNNRDLKTFEVDMNNSIRLRKAAPDSVLFVSESGIKTHEDIVRLRENNISAVLIGETLMRSTDKKGMLSKLNNG